MKKIYNSIRYFNKFKILILMIKIKLLLYKLILINWIIRFGNILNNLDFINTFNVIRWMDPFDILINLKFKF